MKAISVSHETTRRIISDQIREWSELMEGSRIACVVAERIRDETMKKSHIERMEKCVMAIEQLESMLEELGVKNENAG